MDTVFRAFNAQVDDVSNADRSITAKISTSSIDRHNTVFDARGCDLRNYVQNRVVLWEHSRDPHRGALPIGTNLWIKVDRSDSPKLIARTKFKKDDFSQQLFEAYRDGEMSGWSISALPSEFGPPTKEEVRARPELANVELMFRKYDLCEYSAVAVPSCADALSEADYRSISKLISRGIPVPNEITEALKQFSETLAVQESTGLILPEDAIEDKPVDEEERNHKCSEPADEDEDEEEEDEEDAEKRYIKHEGGKWVIYSEKGKKLGEYDSEEAAKKRLDQIEYFKNKDGNRSISEPEEPALPTIELPPLNGRTFQQVYWRLMQDEAEFRSKVLEELNARIDWMCGKV